MILSFASCYIMWGKSYFILHFNPPGICCLVAFICFRQASETPSTWYSARRVIYNPSCSPSLHRPIAKYFTNYHQPEFTQSLTFSVSDNIPITMAPPHRTTNGHIPRLSRLVGRRTALKSAMSLSLQLLYFMKEKGRGRQGV